MEDDKLDLPAFFYLPSDPGERYSELERILGLFRPRLDEAIARVEDGTTQAASMAMDFFEERRASSRVKKEWPFTIDDHGKTMIFGGDLTIQAQTPELVDAYLEEFQELVAAKMPQHMRNCRYLEALFVLYEPFAKDMVLRYTNIDTLEEDRDHHNAFVAIGKGPFRISLWIDMKSGEQEYQWNHGNPTTFSSEGFREDVVRHNKKHNIYVLDHPSYFISSEELLRYGPLLIGKKYDALQQEASTIKEEMDKLSGRLPGKLDN